MLVDAAGAPRRSRLRVVRPARRTSRSTRSRTRSGTSSPAAPACPLGAQVSVAKLAYLRDDGLELRGLRWFNLPEFVAAVARRRQSRASTRWPPGPGCSTRTPARRGPRCSSASASTGLPACRSCGGRRSGGLADRLPRPSPAPELTVAGHDHLVAAVAGASPHGDATTSRWAPPRCCCASSTRPRLRRARGRLADAPDQRGAPRRPGQARARRRGEDRSPDAPHAAARPGSPTAPAATGSTPT